ncbi:MAG: hypothetical protein RMK64_08475 [Rhodovarius sp.]|nr:hypothetical protein [Rhodovarius sp.]MCX7932262.1 hypothetical protein [Rhodovarius sp.]MDW8314988.1 hypothetical protein [Rhodovarius sp.]
MMALHADWSVQPAKRVFALARRGAAGWRAEAPRPVGDPAQLLAGLLAEGVPLAVGLDLPLGLPRAYAAGCAEEDFPSFLRGLADRPGFFAVNETLATVGRDRPFYPARGVKGMTRLSLAQALGLPDAAALCRWCDLATAERPAGAPLFWTLGANQSGKAAIAAWRDWLAPALAAGAPYALWPFQGGLVDLLAPGRAVLAEVYPAEALRQLGLRLSGSKRDCAARRALAPGLLAAMRRLGVEPAPDMREAIEAGFGTGPDGEDRLDCTLGLLCLIQVLEGARPDTVPEDDWVRRWEGWVLGQAALPRGLSQRGG